MKHDENLTRHQLHHRDEVFGESDNIPLAGAVVLLFLRRGFTASESESSSSELLSTCGVLLVEGSENRKVMSMAYHTTVCTSAALRQSLVTSSTRRVMRTHASPETVELWILGYVFIIFNTSLPFSGSLGVLR